MQRKKAKEKRMSHSLNSHWSKYKLREIPLLILHHSLTQATFIRQRTNFRPAEKFDRTLGSLQPVRTIFIWPWKMVSVSVRYLFYQPSDEKIKTGTLRFPAKENPNMEKALFNWPIVLQYDVKAKYRLISRKFFRHEVFSAERLPNQPKATRICIRSKKPIKLLYFRSFVVSVLFERFYFKVIRKSLYYFCSVHT